jgi:hypothetical protein
VVSSYNLSLLSLSSTLLITFVLFTFMLDYSLLRNFFLPNDGKSFGIVELMLLNACEECIITKKHLMNNFHWRASNVSQVLAEHSEIENNITFHNFIPFLFKGTHYNKAYPLEYFMDKKLEPLRKHIKPRTFAKPKEFSQRRDKTSSFPSNVAKVVVNSIESPMFSPGGSSEHFMFSPR